MATKTITIDLEAYEALRRRKGKGESFSDVIKKHFAGGVKGKELGPMLRDLDISRETLDHLDGIVSERGSAPARVPEL